MSKFAAVSPGGGGYVLADSDGNLETYGDVGPFVLPDKRPGSPVCAVAIPTDGAGLWLFHEDGEVEALGGAHPLERHTANNAPPDPAAEGNAQAAADARIAELEEELRVARATEAGPAEPFGHIAASGGPTSA